MLDIEVASCETNCDKNQIKLHYAQKKEIKTSLIQPA